MPENITSRKNAEIQAAAALVSSAEKRRESGSFVVEGARLCRDAAQSDTAILRLFYTRHAYEKYKEYILPVAERAAKSFEISPHVADLLADTKNSQGVFCLCEMARQTPEIKGKIVVLENLQDPANLGAALRTGEAVGLGGFLLLGDCCDPYGPKAVRASMGAVFRVPLGRIESPAPLLAAGYTLYAAVADRGAESITKIVFKEKSAVFIGNEGSGLSESARSACHSAVTIPMPGRAESLNAAAAAAIIMWEMMR